MTKKEINKIYSKSNKFWMNQIWIKDFYDVWKKCEASGNQDNIRKMTKEDFSDLKDVLDIDSISIEKLQKFYVFFSSLFFLENYKIIKIL